MAESFVQKVLHWLKNRQTTFSRITKNVNAHSKTARYSGTNKINEPQDGLNKVIKNYKNGFKNTLIEKEIVAADKKKLFYYNLSENLKIDKLLNLIEEKANSNANNTLSLLYHTNKFNLYGSYTKKLLNSDRIICKTKRLQYNNLSNFDTNNVSFSLVETNNSNASSTNVNSIDVKKSSKDAPIELNKIITMQNCDKKLNDKYVRIPQVIDETQYKSNDDAKIEISKSQNAYTKNNANELFDSDSTFQHNTGVINSKNNTFHFSNTNYEFGLPNIKTDNKKEISNTYSLFNNINNSDTAIIDDINTYSTLDVDLNNNTTYNPTNSIDSKLSKSKLINDLDEKYSHYFKTNIDAYTNSYDNKIDSIGFKEESADTKIKNTPEDMNIIDFSLNVQPTNQLSSNSQNSFSKNDKISFNYDLTKYDKINNEEIGTINIQNETIKASGNNDIINNMADVTNINTNGKSESAAINLNNSKSMATIKNESNMNLFNSLDTTTYNTTNISKNLGDPTITDKEQNLSNDRNFQNKDASIVDTTILNNEHPSSYLKDFNLPKFSLDGKTEKKVTFGDIKTKLFDNSNSIIKPESQSLNLFSSNDTKVGVFNQKDGEQDINNTLKLVNNSNMDNFTQLHLFDTTKPSYGNVDMYINEKIDPNESKTIFNIKADNITSIKTNSDENKFDKHEQTNEQSEERSNANEPISSTDKIATSNEEILSELFNANTIEASTTNNMHNNKLNSSPYTDMHKNLFDDEQNTKNKSNKQANNDNISFSSSVSNNKLNFGKDFSFENGTNLFNYSGSTTNNTTFKQNMSSATQNSQNNLSNKVFNLTNNKNEFVSTEKSSNGKVESDNCQVNSEDIENSTKSIFDTHIDSTNVTHPTNLPNILVNEQKSGILPGSADQNETNKIGSNEYIKFEQNNNTVFAQTNNNYNKDFKQSMNQLTTTNTNTNMHENNSASNFSVLPMNTSTFIEPNNNMDNSYTNNTLQNNFFYTTSPLLGNMQNLNMDGTGMQYTNNYNIDYTNQTAKRQFTDYKSNINNNTNLFNPSNNLPLFNSNTSIQNTNSDMARMPFFLSDQIQNVEILPNPFSNNLPNTQNINFGDPSKKSGLMIKRKLKR